MLISHAIDRQYWSPIQLSLDGPKLSDFLLADDVVLLSKADM